MERAIAGAAAAALGAALYLGLVRSANHARAQLRASVTVLQTQAVKLEREAAEIERLKAVPVPPAPRLDLRALVQEQAGAAGLSRALGRIEAPTPDQVQLSFGAVGFPDWLAWVARMQSRQLTLDSCRIETLSTPGLVSVTATLVRAR